MRWQCRDAVLKKLRRSRSAYRLRPTRPAKHGGRGKDWPARPDKPRPCCLLQHQVADHASVFEQNRFPSRLSEWVLATEQLTAGHVGIAVRLSARGLLARPVDQTNKSIGVQEKSDGQSLIRPHVRSDGELRLDWSRCPCFSSVSFPLPILSAGPSAGAGFTVRAPATSVNHEFKSDRLPLPSDANSAFSKNVPQRPQGSKPIQGLKEIPDGCDPSFSPITTPQLAHVFGRCTT